ELKKQIEVIEGKLSTREEVLIEQMLAGDVQSINVGGRCLYRHRDLIVGKAAGVDAEDLMSAMVAAELGDLIKEGYAPSSLKSAVREWRDRAAAADAMGKRSYCRACGQFFAYELVARQCPNAGDDHNAPLAAVVDGIPERLHGLLYIEVKTK